MLTHYQTLELHEQATPDQIRAAYKRLAFIYHPDRNNGSHFHEERFKQIANAYSILQNPDERALYDYKLSVSRMPPPKVQQPVNGSPTYNGASPYGSFGTYRFETQNGAGKTGRPGETGGRDFKMRRTTPVSPHQVFIGIVLMSCIAMASLWFGDLMNRRTARAHLEVGDYVTALQFDSTFGEAWHAKGVNLLARGYLEEAEADLTKGIMLTDTASAAWFYTLATVQIALGKQAIAKRNLYASLMRKQTDSARFQLAIMVQKTRPDSALALIEMCSLPFKKTSAVLFTLSATSLKLNKPSKAAFYAQQALDAGSDPGPTFYLLGTSQIYLSDTLKACYSFNQSLQNGFNQAVTAVDYYCTR
jgi:curved DNA-binding protein CbpA